MVERNEYLDGDFDSQGVDDPNKRELTQAVPGTLASIHANGKVWSVKKLAEGVLRKMQPVGTVLKSYFPLGDRARAAVAWLGNEKHNPGQHLHWAEGKSDDHVDCVGRHLSEPDDWDVTVLPDGRVYAVLHAAQLAWRASAIAELAARKYGGTVIVELINPQVGESRQDRSGQALGREGVD